MTESTENLQINLQPDKDDSVLSFLGGKIKLNTRQIGICKVIIPLVVITVCAVVMWSMLEGVLQSGSNIDGRFASSVNAETDYIDINSNGEYTISSAGNKEKGQWELNGNIITFKSGKKTLSGQFVERKYIVIKDDSFLLGEVKTDSEKGAEVTASDGTVYGFSPDGKFYSIVDGAYAEIGNYIADGYFIVVTTVDGNIITYLNCGSGITSVFYQAV